MGLLITAYSAIRRIEDPGYEPGYAEDDVIHVFTLKGHEARIRDLRRGYYRSTAVEEDFSIGGYSSYSVWRDALAHAIHGVSDETVWERAHVLEAAALAGADMPAFYELIHFADNEGCIGPSVCRKLHRDFMEHQGTFLKWAAWQPYDFGDTYRKFVAAFAIAATGDCGIVQFR